jgi:ferredoxin-NADP reductase
MRVVDMDREDLFSPAVVHDIEYLSPDICRIFLEPATPLYYRAGQFMNIRREDGLTRSYSLASVPSLDNRLEYHVTLKERWLRYDMGTKAAIVKTSIDECEGRYKNEKPIIVPKPA